MNSRAGEWIVGHGDIISDKGCFPGWNIQEYILNKPTRIDGLGSLARIGVVVFTKKGKPSRDHFLQIKVQTKKPSSSWFPPSANWRNVETDVILDTMEIYRRTHHDTVPILEMVELGGGIGNCIKETSCYPCARVGVSVLAFEWSIPRILHCNRSLLAIRTVHPNVKNMTDAIEIDDAIVGYHTSVNQIKYTNSSGRIGHKLKRIEEYRMSMKKCEDEDTAICEEAADAMNELSEKYGIEIAI